LAHLSLESNSLDWKAGPLIADMLRNIPNAGNMIKGLNSLNLRGNRLKVCFSRITKLKIGLLPVFEALARNQTLKVLNLRKVCLNEYCLASLAVSLVRYECLYALEG
jgi:hypothetical protein